MLTTFFQKKPVRITLFVAGGFLAFLALFPIFFQEKISSIVRQTLEKQVRSELRFAEVNLSFFRHFPSLTLSVDELYLGGSEPFAQDTLLFTKELALGISLPSLFGSKLQIDEIYLNEATVKIRRDLAGHSNFDIIAPSTDSIPADSSSFDLEIEGLFFRESRFVYQDESIDLHCLAEGISYTGEGKLEADLLNLQSQISIADFHLDYAEIPLFHRNSLEANLLTRINTETTALVFERNQLKINKLPLNFVGAFEFIPGGYDMNFVLESFDASLGDLVSLIPEEYFPAGKDSRFEGKGNLVASLQGQYLENGNAMPGLALNLGIQGGQISGQAAPEPIRDLLLQFNLRVPELDPQQMNMHLDTLSFRLGAGHLRSRAILDGMNPMQIDATLSSQLDLALLHQALGTQGLDFRGTLAMEGKAAGTYRFGLDPTALRHPEPVILGIPKFTLAAKLTDGYLKWANLPQAIQSIGLDFKAEAQDSIPSHVDYRLNSLSIQAMDQQVTGGGSYLGSQGHQVDGFLRGELDLGTIAGFYPLDSGYRLAGKVLLDAKAKGNYLPEKKSLPVMAVDFTLREGTIQTPYYPDPIEEISCILSVRSSTSSFTDFSFDLKPVSFRFGGEPFLLQANLSNLNDIRYDIQSKGRLDLGKIYRVFGIEGTDIQGYLLTDLSLKGTQQAALRGDFGQLDNSGTLRAEKIALSTDLLPEPLYLNKGFLEFDKEKVVFEDFQLSFRENQVSLSGFFTNYLSYSLIPGEVLRGEVSLSSHYLNLDDFLFFGEEEPVKTDSIGLATGVILPSDVLQLRMLASVDSIRFGDYRLRNFKGSVQSQPRKIMLEKTTFETVGALVSMNGSYEAKTPFAANFDYQIIVEKFDIKRAYQEVPLFQEMVPFAAYAEGIAGLNYQLSGRLNANMEPVYPSLIGKGSLILSNVKLKGFKLGNSIAEKTEHPELKDPELNEVEIQTTLANNLMTIPRTRIRIAGFRPRIEGQVSLDGKLSLGMRIGLPPLGVFGIPIQVTGEAADPQIRLGKITKQEELEGVFDEPEPDSDTTQNKKQ